MPNDCAWHTHKKNSTTKIFINCKYTGYSKLKIDRFPRIRLFSMCFHIMTMLNIISSFPGQQTKCILVLMFHKCSILLIRFLDFEHYLLQWFFSQQKSSSFLYKGHYPFLHQWSRKSFLSGSWANGIFLSILNSSKVGYFGEGNKNYQ